MLEGWVEKGRVVVRRRGTPLVRLPITRHDGRLFVMETCAVIAQEGHLVVPTLTEGEDPEHKKT